MKRVLMLTGDVNLMNVTDAQVPFARIKDTLRRADVLFGNLECCFYEPVDGHSLEHEGFPAPLAPAGALVGGGFRAVGTANHVNYGGAPIRLYLRRLMRRALPCTGAASARRCAVADVVMGHGPHYACSVEMYRGKPVFYGLGGFSFHTGHGGRAHGDWVGMLARLTFDDSELLEVAFSLVRHNERNETYVCDLGQDKEAVEQITRRCTQL